VNSLLSRLPGAVGPASRCRRRYADAPAAALLTSLATREWSPLALRHALLLATEELWGSAYHGFAERLIGSIRRECLDRIIVLGEAHLRRVLKSHARDYNQTRTHLAWDKDAPYHAP
jgi:Integrase core domain